MKGMDSKWLNLSFLMSNYHHEKDYFETFALNYTSQELA